ncbi:bifunctional 23S rRNA (guanine(2069)-N(7))-methyltransferase RlmK/23S rRNA (guanine(2445)-N(2))-methyltransferase RlmL [Buchnera aphidicola]|uniref:bifunctional 23S rRNA (guanine(2069)-N(7))-methyltransferase RlmK/23S rRNA (guanine(2445)-N(2))-methyltransferase RlmL n=1 Tax=Buchnera aphidicola TaxID=9 RepID=UPI003BEF1E61
MNYLFASTHFGCEDLLEKELLSLGATNLELIKGGIYYTADEYTLYNILMWTRIASRVFLCIKKFTITNSNDLYFNTYQIHWDTIFDSKKTFMINFKGTNNIIRNSLFGVFTIKDAIIDYFYKKQSLRPIVNRISPDIRIKAVLFNNIIYLMLNLSGESLHKRGYSKVSKNITPIKKNLGISIVLRSKWNKNTPLIDPMCGSGTLLIEAAMLCSNRAPGLRRKKWGFENWKQYNQETWVKIKKIALEKFKIGIKKCNQDFLGYDYDINSIKEAKICALNAGVSQIVKFFNININNFKNVFNQTKIGTILSNPPYGERQQTESQLVALYIHIGYITKKYFTNWNLSIFSASTYLLNFIQMKCYQEYIYKNGPLDCFQRNYNIFDDITNKTENEYTNRLKKNIKRLKKWSILEGIECFRVYDADLPNYNIIVDIYKNWIVVQEYEAPKEINTHNAYKRLCKAIYETRKILSIPINNIVLKIRKKQKNGRQYQKLHNKNTFFIVKEYNTKFLVNLIDYLDTGLFSDKRLIRKIISEMSYGKSFLNLFCYTSTASVVAGLGGAISTTNIDISKTYLQWSIKNMSINNLMNKNHHFIQSDCLDWLKKNNKMFDLIFVNPPTFSHSKKTNKKFELKKDYFTLIINLKRILKKNGTIIFSSSTHNFDMNLKDLNQIKLYAKNITAQTKSKDSFNSKNIYHSWLITHIQ